MTTKVIFDLFLRCGKVSTDTRKVQPGDLFVALKGERFDGNKFAAKALEAGANAAIVDDPAVIPPGDARYYLVSDGLKALQDLGRTYRRSFNIPFLAITGSNGKTTTKELAHSVLSTEIRTFSTHGNYNNHIGVPLTLLSIPTNTEIAIIEMGANQAGDIRELAGIAEPTHGLITNIGQAHLERFGSLEGVQGAKGELFDFLRAHQGQLFVNMADERVVRAAVPQSEDIRFGREDSDYHIRLKRHSLEGMELVVEGRGIGLPLELKTQLSGEYNAMNVLVAAMLGHYFGVSREGLQKGIHQYIPSNNRSQIVEVDGKTILLDAYNANPSSMRAAIANVFGYETSKIALILGDMFEMGTESEQIHLDLGKYIDHYQPLMTIGVGPNMQAMISQLQSQGHWFPDTASAAKEVKTLTHAAEMILIKGSRGMALENLLDSFS